ncbi:hypothetical protein C8R46DRAFT_1192462 [Mycena filopes]|nr:hypothetical protein C8R46DRAFT_1192462 [Mycena filopes]
MLSQMPTSALSFPSSSSKGLDGFFGLISVGIQMALTVVLAEFNTEFTTAVRATATVKLALQPTKCVISNGTGFHPYVATMGSATIVLLVLSYMLLRGKGRDIGDGDPAAPPSAKKPDPDSAGQPPSPPEDPETESSPKKRRNRWALFLLVILVWTMTLGPAVVHTCSMWLIFFLIAIYQIPRGIIRLGRHPLDWRHICFVLGGTIGITAIDSVHFTFFMATEYYRALAPDRKPFFWRYPFSLEAKYRIQYVYWDWFYEYQDQKAAQNEAFATLVFELPRVFKAEIRPVLELWCSFAWFQKFLIIAPAVLIYIYCDMRAKSDEFTKGGDVGAEKYSHLG